MPQQHAQAVPVERVILVVRANLQQQAEAAAIAADPEGGAGTFVPGTPLRAAGDMSNTVVAYWSNWAMLEGQRAIFAREMGGPNNVIAPGGNVNQGAARWMFDANEPNGWTADQVLAALGFDTLWVEV